MRLKLIILLDFYRDICYIKTIMFEMKHIMKLDEIINGKDKFMVVYLGGLKYIPL